MYINPFLAGVLCTLSGQAIGLIIYGIYKVRKEKNNGKDKE